MREFAYKMMRFNFLSDLIGRSAKYVFLSSSNQTQRRERLVFGDQQREHEIYAGPNSRNTLVTKEGGSTCRHYC